MAKRRHQLLVVPHTHWDRAWYWPFERFRTKLIVLFQAMIRMFKAHPQYRFTCDGQTVMLEDYLEVAPLEVRSVIKHLATGGTARELLLESHISPRELEWILADMMRRGVVETVEKHRGASR